MEGKKVPGKSLTKREAMDKVMLLVAAGHTVTDSMRQVGREYVTYTRWRERDPAWAKKMSNLVKLQRTGKHTEDRSTFAEFRSLYFDRDTPTHHARMITAVEKAKPDSITTILAFPEAAKTSLLTDWCCYQIGTNPNYRIAAISEGQDLSRKFLGQIQQRMTDRTMFNAFIDAYGPFKGDGDMKKPWTADFFRVVKCQADEKEPSMEARGAGSALYGGRYDLMLLDDIQSDRNLDATPKLLRYLRQTVLTRPAKGSGKTIVIGSRVGEKDIYEVMEDEGMVDTLITIPALTQWVDKDDMYEVVRGKVAVNPDCKAESTWPEWWSMEQLATRRKKVGEEVWTRTYMQQPVFQAAATFPRYLVEQAKDTTRGLGFIDGHVGTGVLFGVDPALDTGRMAITVCAYNQTEMWVLEVVSRTDINRGEDILAEISRLASLYHPQAVVVETNHYQKALARDERMIALGQKFGFDVIDHNTGRNKNDPVFGVAMMSSAFSDHEIHIPWGDLEARENMSTLVGELLRWRPARGTKLQQDTVMALWFCWTAWNNRKHSTGALIQRPRPTWMSPRSLRAVG